LIFLVAAPFGLLASHVYERRHDSIASVLTGGRGAVLLALGVVAAALLVARGVLFRLLDRWFDRRDADRHGVLARAGERFRLVRTWSELVSAVDAAAEGALNAPAEVCLYDVSKKAYIPVGRGGLPLSGDSALATMLTQEPSISALRTDGDRSIARLLPSVERLWLEGRQAGMVAPVRAVGMDRPSGIVVFGARRDAPGYSREDEQFVTALMSSAAMALDNLRLKAEAIGPADDDLGALCVRCRLVADAATADQTCACGGTLKPASVPRRIYG
jgi:GAF domain-containing protein